MQIWQSLSIKTQYESIPAGVSGLNNASNRQGTKFWHKGIIGELSSTGAFDLILNRGRYKEYHFVGNMEVQDNQVVLKGVVKPLMRNIAIFKIALGFFAMASLYEFVQNIGVLGIMGSFISIVSMLALTSFGIGFIYLLLRLNAHIAATRIKSILQNEN